MCSAPGRLVVLHSPATTPTHTGSLHKHDKGILSVQLPLLDTSGGTLQELFPLTPCRFPASNHIGALIHQSSKESATCSNPTSPQQNEHNTELDVYATANGFGLVPSSCYVWLCWPVWGLTVFLPLTYLSSALGSSPAQSFLRCLRDAPSSRCLHQGRFK